ncbi:Carbohydrate kinase FGGY [uncultured Pleomorphomonas sp.]|uniref:Carbohydrate kinase FGGY n=1 Tax=uncultured Pleomorphomonas sp. TaxID=442121 RepID=A0A212LBU6_9HYPH|nr:FGGY family carbohydrate kinase [uncultured Pleomorphomonas sp.]SCM75034.1 Carbohydrate kinase FGGY [uncultured Pleomorphomonas sp.]
MSGLYCGVDIGSTNIKVVLVDEVAGVIARRRRPTPRLGQDTAGARAGEAEPLVLLKALEDMIIDAWRQAAGGRPIAAIAATGVGEDGCLIDAHLRPLSTAIPWFDNRAAAEADELASAHDCVDVTGLAFEPTRTAAKWLWIARHRPVPVVTGWIALTDFPAAWWSGRTFLSETLAARTACYDISARVFRDDLLAAARAPTLPPVLPAGATVGPMRPGRLTQAGAATTATRLVAGGHDHPVAASVAHRLHPDAIVDSLGTAELVYGETDRSAPPRPGIVRSVAVLPGREARFKVFELAAALAPLRLPTPSGDLLSDLLAAAEISAEAAPSVDPADHAAVAAILAQANESDARRIAAALLVACARVTAGILDDLAASGVGDGPLFATGGWSRSDALMRLRAGILGRPIHRIDEPELAALGAALIAGARPDLAHVLKISRIDA